MGMIRTPQDLSVQAGSAVLAGLVVLGAGLLEGAPGPSGYLSALTGLADRPTAAALLAAAAGVAFWRAPVSRAPLTTLTLIAPLFDALAAGACLALAAFAFARYDDRVRPRAWFLIAATVWALAPAAAGLVAGTGTLRGSGPSIIGGVAYVWAPFALGLWLAARQQVLDQMRDRAEQLKRERKIVADQARARERTRIAHDMHDVVAHRVSLMVLHAGALEVNTHDAAAAESAELIRTVGVEALAELRTVLGLLHGDRTESRPPETPTLDNLVQDSVHAGLPVRLHRTGLPLHDLPPHLERTVYRAVREALTNIHKHAGPVPCSIELHTDPHRILLRVRNAPPRDRPDLPGTGTGLIALREAVTLFGGKMTAGPCDDGGYELHVDLPLASRGRSAAGAA
ncbi:sensor histidine kinase [Glycomyces albidus]|uniref:histidine kinase n=1 Tax=Glycomyces albidus TaxID=2656774 RepID=A0A6L5GEA3_9ACTN|nr:histidine kinase [Glycomyces albidus]MQM27925.1 hypothetical protein [Glycomyces albidus]